MLPILSVAGDLSAGKLIHTGGPAAAKLLSRRVVRVCVWNRDKTDMLQSEKETSVTKQNTHTRLAAWRSG